MGAQGARGACGFTLLFLPKMMSWWTAVAPKPSGKSASGRPMAASYPAAQPSYGWGTAWVYGPLPCHSGRNEQHSRQLHVTLSSRKGVDGQRLTGGFTLAFTHTPPRMSESDVVPAAGSPRRLRLYIIVLARAPRTQARAMA